MVRVGRRVKVKVRVRRGSEIGNSILRGEMERS